MKLGSQRNQCQGCKQYFNSNAAFDKHRVGKHGLNRRCLTPDEMTAKGMMVNHAGFWITEAYDPTIKRKNDETKGNQDGA